MAQTRTFDERKRILKAIISGDEKEISAFNLDASEDNFFRTRAAKALDSATKRTSFFKAYYALPTAQPFLYVVVPSLTIALAAGIFAIIVYSAVADPSKAAPIFAACISISVIALGWTFAGWNSHNNTIRQNTNNLLFARFAHQSFSDALHRFHDQFGTDKGSLISWEKFETLRKSSAEDERKAAAALVYLLNYFEFVASGVVRGDLDKKVVSDNVRGNIEFYYDICQPVIWTVRKSNPRTFEYLSKIRTHYREP